MVYILYTKAVQNLYKMYTVFENNEEAETAARAMNAKANAPIALVRPAYNMDRAPLSIQPECMTSHVSTVEHSTAITGESRR